MCLVMEEMIFSNWLASLCGILCDQTTASWYKHQILHILQRNGWFDFEYVVINLQLTYMRYTLYSMIQHNTGISSARRCERERKQKNRTISTVPGQCFFCCCCCCCCRCCRCRCVLWSACHITLLLNIFFVVQFNLIMRVTVFSYKYTHIIKFTWRFLVFETSLTFSRFNFQV